MHLWVGPLCSDEAQELDLCFFNEERTVVSVGCDQCDRTRATVCFFEHTHTHFSYFIKWVLQWPGRYVAATIFTSKHLLDLGQWDTPQLWHFIWHCTHCTVHITLKLLQCTFQCTVYKYLTKYMQQYYAPKFLGRAKGTFWSLNAFKENRWLLRESAGHNYPGRDLFIGEPILLGGWSKRGWLSKLK